MENLRKVGALFTPNIIMRIHYLCGMLVFGTATAISMKIQLEMTCKGYGGIEHKFEKPFFQSIAMFVSMACALPISYAGDMVAKFRAGRRGAEGADKPLLAGNTTLQEGAEPAVKKSKNPFIVAVPCCFDLLASTLMTFGLIYISVSVFQMLRGSMVIFSAGLSFVFLHRPIRLYQGVGLLICVSALILVGIAGAMIPVPGMSVTTFQTIMGCSLVVFSQLIQAGQLVTEEFLLKNLDLGALKIVGFEGVWGSLLMIFVACPLAYLVPGSDFSTMTHNSLENTYDSFICLFDSVPLIGCTTVFMFSVLAYNCYGMLITDVFNAVNRTIFEAVRTTCIWIVDLIIQKIWPDSPYGEYWSNWSYLEAGGFMLLILSSIIYNGILRIPYLKYDQDKPKKEEEQSETPITPSDDVGV
eukprot:TRINITY_DN17162_c0_g1_i1.p1 TRINITY_DN17162_c0_g1~~TRINITY_DN17162_c0_g1_i1.p1  ORF type:complete len:413 (+),score=122.31 TRINITY_DN17162_c0_g1_i1:74-1312(+)